MDEGMNVDTQIQDFTFFEGSRWKSDSFKCYVSFKTLFHENV